MLKKGVPNRNKTQNADSFTSQTPGHLQQSVEYDWFYTDAHFLLFAKKIILLSGQFCHYIVGISDWDGWITWDQISGIHFYLGK